MMLKQKQTTQSIHLLPGRQNFISVLNHFSRTFPSKAVANVSSCSTEGGVASVPVSNIRPTEKGVASVSVSPIKQVWLLCLKVPVEEAWPQYLLHPVMKVLLFSLNVPVTP